MLAAAVLVALPPAVAAAGHGDPARPRLTAAQQAAAFPDRLAAGKLTFPIPDAPGPATLAPGVEALVAGADPGKLLDLVVTLDRPADRRIAGALRRPRRLVAAPSSTSRRPPCASRVARLADLRNLRGVLAVYDNRTLQYFLKDSAKLNNTERAWNDLQRHRQGRHRRHHRHRRRLHPPRPRPGHEGQREAGRLRQDPLPTVLPIDGLPNSDTSSGHGTHVAGDVAGRGTASGGEQKGMAYGADLVGIGTGDGLSIFTALEGYEWLLENREKYGIRVVNNSYGLGFGPFDPMDPINLATKRATDAGVVVVFANGNDGDEMSMNPYATAPWVHPGGGRLQGRQGHRLQLRRDRGRHGRDAASPPSRSRARPASRSAWACTTPPSPPPAQNVVSRPVEHHDHAAHLGCPEDVQNLPPEQAALLPHPVGHLDGLPRGGRDRRPAARGQPGADPGPGADGRSRSPPGRSPASPSTSRATATPTPPPPSSWPRA